MVHKIQEYICLSYAFKDEIDYSYLILDPQSVNWMTPKTSSNVIKQSLVDNLKIFTNNRELKKLFSIYTDKTQSNMIEYLMTITPVFPRALNEIFRLSPEGAKMSFLATFSDMRTLKGMMPVNQAINLLDELESSELTEIKFILTIYLSIKRNNHISDQLFREPKDISKHVKIRFNCTTQLAQWLRNTTWKKNITGVTIPHPSEQFCLFPIKSENNFMIDVPHPCKSETIIYSLVKKSRQSIECETITQRGDLMPYFGSSTSEKRTNAAIPYPKTDRSLKAAQKLNRLRDWVCEERGTLNDFIGDLISTRTSATEEFITLTSGMSYGESAHHRLTDVMTKHAGRPNSRLNVYSNIYFSSDALGKYA